MINRRTALAAAGAIAAAACAAEPPAARAGVTRYRYGADPSQYADISLPGRSEPAPVVVVIHGGFWRSAYGADLGEPLAADLAARGYAAVNLEYRRVGAGGGWPQTGDDVLAALDALPAHADRLDLDRVVALGHSAGGQLAAWLAAARPLTGAVLQAGVLDLVAAAEAGLGGGAVVDFLGGTPAQRPDVYAQASPTARVPLGVASIAVHGTADRHVPISQSERFVAAAQRAGDRAQLRTFDGDHFAPITVGSPAWELCVSAIAELLR
ncbi:S9 family peptidase [Mycobacterium sp. MYCO198283]|uniref:alpha/beta hydrolase family protein n=1 Tax=Mycobacterium sp. MYCO198283 TaxID=2883505 RepID=UPI001E5B473F|nr:prolyl oligopeptidase family serine peptidase [Mycobacterium sp. MYCO198283]MCG5432125.1 S9 family peptidase [Mycobacterium sp. MYCO198283]